MVHMNEDVSGLTVESPVRFNGVNVGFVKSIHLDANKPKLVKIKLAIEAGVPITTSTYAVLNMQGVTGVVYVNLKAETESAPPLKAAQGERLPIIPSKPSFLAQLSEVLPEVATQIKQLSTSIGQVLDAQNQQSIKESLQNINAITKTLANNSDNFTQTMNSLNNALKNISAESNALPGTIRQLNKTLTSVDAASNSFGKTMHNGQTAILNFSNQVIPNAQQAISSLSHASSNVDQLTDELERNPSMLVRGKGPAELGPGER